MNKIQEDYQLWTGRNHYREEEINNNLNNQSYIKNSEVRNGSVIVQN